jgi:hypothetical protein
MGNAHPGNPRHRDLWQAKRRKEMRQLLWILLGIVSGVILAFLVDDGSTLQSIGIAALVAIGVVTGVVTDRVDNAGFLSLGAYIGVVACFAGTMGLVLGTGGAIIGFGIGILYGLPAGIIVFASAGLVILLKHYLARRKAKAAETK